MYADYDFYACVYHGKISEEDYTHYAEKAGAYIDKKTDFLFEKNGLPVGGSSLERRLRTCACALADELYRTETGTAYFKTSEKVGDYAVTYAAEKVSSADERLDSIMELYIPDVTKAVKWL